ncbi:peptidase S9 [Pedobacter psychrophilus]|uniref:Peptidase S9 n=1 Tax=Pedobacter psychrophilus TaxID=1826909 RepID=A0A179DEU8_9SPHI|nr:prolyl oligopeptidase family serine peptidase [Pedobacter psychrophilus]OAQ39576.1 peptidase S9 [Pedobacter psychrophilus]
MRKILLLISFLFTTFYVSAQKKPLDHSVYDIWQSIANEKISNKGNFVGYSITPQAGDAEFHIKKLKSNQGFQYPRGEDFKFSIDEKFAAFTIKSTYQETRQAKIKKKKSDDLPKDSLGILNLKTLELIKIPRIKSYAFPEKVGNVLAYLVDKDPTDTVKKKKPVSKTDNDFFFADETPAAAAKEGTNLTLKNLENGTETIFKGVTDYQLSKYGNFIMYVCTGIKKDSSLKAGVYLYDIQKQKSKLLTSGKGIYKNLSFDEKATQLAFTGNKSPEKALTKIHQLYYYNFKTDSATIIANENTIGMPSKSSVSENGKVFFSKNAGRLFFGTAPIPTPKDTTIVDFEVAKLDIWNYKDDYLQPMQLANLSKTLKKNYMAMIDLKSNSFMQLGSEELENIDLADEGNANYALGTSDFGNRISIQWEGGSKNAAYIINLESGEKKLINEASKANYQLSPKGKNVIWFDDKSQIWYDYNIVSDKKTQFIAPANIKFGDEENDVPDDPNSYGFAAFTEDENEALIYDRYDIWAFNTQTGTVKNITNGYGRKNNITLKYVRLDAEQKFISAKETILLSALNNRTKQNGFFEKDMAKTSDPKLLVMGNYSFSRPIKAKEANVLIYEKDNYETSPTLFASADFKKEEKLATTNPQQSDFNWGTAELVHWTTPKGYQSDGVLYKPENFDPTKKYPMIVYFYEKVTDNLYNYQAPAPTPSRLNISYFVSNGYLVFTPDISYETGHPGKSAEEFINSGVEMLKKNNWVDETKIGIQGQSWGGYQVAHLITVTNMYTAAWAGAPVVNMFSAYGGIRWTSGLNRQFQYEKTQSRIGATIWERPDLYIENSPLFKMPSVQTPVAIMANDADGSVPWYQGIEMFTALRRLNKPVWLLVYNGEDHNLVQRQNRKDISIREQQFFDHYLKGAPAPEWMEKGVPATEKGKDWGFKLMDK